jgi:hypothetical protein
VRPTRRSVRRAYEFLTVVPEDISLNDPLERRVFLQIGNTLICDATQVTATGRTFRPKVPIAVGQSQAKSFEKQVHERLGRHGDQPFPSGRRFRGDRGIFLTDLDASCVVNNVLVVVDTYASPWSPDLDIGSYNATRNRVDRLKQKLVQWDARWNDIVENHSHLLPASIVAILPVVVTAVTEWIDTKDPTLWLTDEIPRICTVGELEIALSRPDLRRHRAAITRGLSPPP